MDIFLLQVLGVMAGSFRLVNYPHYAHIGCNKVCAQLRIFLIKKIVKEYALFID